MHGGTGYHIEEKTTNKETTTLLLTIENKANTLQILHIEYPTLSRYISEIPIRDCKKQKRRAPSGFVFKSQIQNSRFLPLKHTTI